MFGELRGVVEGGRRLDREIDRLEGELEIARGKAKETNIERARNARILDSFIFKLCESSKSSNLPRLRRHLLKILT
jgi:hypothetical protein